MGTEKPNIYNKNEMLEKLAQCGFFISLETLNSYIKKLRIDAIYENVEGVELFDNSAVEKISAAICEKKKEEVVGKEFPTIIPENEKKESIGLNAFKLDISENTLNMVARAIAKKVAKNVSSFFGIDEETNKKLAALEEKNLKLYTQLGEVEKENQKLRLLLREANQNLNAYKPAAFGLYKFTGKKRDNK